MKLALIAALCLVCSAASAQQVVRVSYGTGFFVNDSGDFITNRHVVEACNNQIRAENDQLSAPAAVVALSNDADLALLSIKRHSTGVAQLRSMSDALKLKERVIVPGHPMGKALSTREGVIEETKGPRGEAEYIQFSNVVEKGNSGGPLLDESGRIIGVVTAKVKATTYNTGRAREETVRETDVAIALPTLMQFLSDNRIEPRIALGTTNLSADRVETQMRDTIVRVSCQVK